jgi:hypothetical protein
MRQGKRRPVAVCRICLEMALEESLELLASPRLSRFPRLAQAGGLIKFRLEFQLGEI